MRTRGVVIAAVLATAGCEVERDLDPARFACAQGGPCDAGAGAEDAGLTDSGIPALGTCPGVYDGVIVGGPDLGTLGGTLDFTGRLELRLVSLNRPTGLPFVAQVQSDLTVVAVGPEVTLTGRLSASTCAIAGTVDAGDGPGNYTIERQ